LPINSQHALAIRRRDGQLIEDLAIAQQRLDIMGRENEITAQVSRSLTVSALVVRRLGLRQKAASMSADLDGVQGVDRRREH
jgi:hypothetical protein